MAIHEQASPCNERDINVNYTKCLFIEWVELLPFLMRVAFQPHIPPHEDNVVLSVPKVFSSIFAPGLRWNPICIQVFLALCIPWKNQKDGASGLHPAIFCWELWMA